jgi:hypothetical protein
MAKLSKYLVDYVALRRILLNGLEFSSCKFRSARYQLIQTDDLMTPYQISLHSPHCPTKCLNICNKMTLATAVITIMPLQQKLTVLIHVLTVLALMQ